MERPSGGAAAADDTGAPNDRRTDGRRGAESGRARPSKGDSRLAESSSADELELDETASNDDDVERRALAENPSGNFKFQTVICDLRRFAISHNNAPWNGAESRMAGRFVRETAAELPPTDRVART